MSDHDAAPDPIDKAYAEAEAVLRDDSARAARRARVLAAVGREPATAPAVSSPRMPRSAWRRGGWGLVAASVAGLSVFLATQVYPPASIEQTAPTTSAAPAPTAGEVAGPSAPADTASSHTPKPAPRTLASPPPPETSSTSDLARIPPPPAPHRIAQAPASPRAESPASPPDEGLSELVVTGARRDSAVAPPEPEVSPGSPAELAARLRDAAAAGRTAEVAALLAKGVPVDAPDDDGETALMKSIQADQPAAAALLRRHGASLDHKNHAGESARDMATSIGDAELNQALGLSR